LKNVAKWAFDIDPNSGERGPIQVDGNVAIKHGTPVILAYPDGAGGSNCFALFGRRKDAAASGLTYTVETSADLLTWTALADTPAVVAQDSEIEAVTVAIPPPPAGWQQNFFRVTVTAQ
jgi:hypothetical protein